MRKMICEILEEAGKAKTKEKKVEILRQYADITLLRVLHATYDKGTRWLLPNTDPPYHASHASYGHEKLFSESRKLYMFLEGGSPNLKQSRREELFIGFLEAIHPHEAQMILKAKKKKPFPGLSEEVIREAFPDLLSVIEKPTPTEGQEVISNVENT